VSCIEEIRSAAQGLGLQLSYLEASEGTALERMLGSVARDSTDAVAVCWDGVTLTNARAIAELALRQRVPAVAPLREYVKAGTLMSFGTNLPAQRRRAAYYVDRILKGAKPADLPVEQPTLFELVVNMTTAKRLGLTMPTGLVVLADELIE
jgi:putative ABC transport system substrate-binding protein